jgi:hypothetical protein
MRPLTYKKHRWLILVALSFFIVVSCNKKSNITIPCGACPLDLVALPNINFRVVDKVTSQDLFFGSAAPYKINQLVIHQVVNGVQDTVFLRVDTVNHIFNIAVAPNHPVDTVTMQVANKPQDILLFETATVDKCCPRLVLNSVLFNGATVYTMANGPSIVVLGI